MVNPLDAAITQLPVRCLTRNATSKILQCQSKATILMVKVVMTTRFTRSIYIYIYMPEDQCAAVLYSFRLTTHQIPIVHDENAITCMSLPRPYYTLSQRWPSQPRISLYLHSCLTHRGPPHSITATHPTCTSIHNNNN